MPMLNLALKDNRGAELFKIVDIATAQLETAIRLFFYAEDYFSVITLAGASEEIFGKILKKLGKEPALDSFANTFSVLVEVFDEKEIPVGDFKSAANLSRNRIKHFDSWNDLEVIIDPRGDALEMLQRATGNYTKLNLPESEVVQRFLTYDDERD